MTMDRANRLIEACKDSPCVRQTLRCSTGRNRTIKTFTNSGGRAEVDADGDAIGVQTGGERGVIANR